MAGGEREIDTWRDMTDRIADGHISRYVGNWADAGFTGTDWELGYNDARRTLIDEWALRGGQLARCYLIHSASRAGSSTAAIWGPWENGGL